MLTVALLSGCGLPDQGPAAAAEPIDETQAILSAVVDDEASRIESITWAPLHALVLAEHVLEAVPLDVRGVVHGVVGPARHDDDWLTLQASKPGVGGSCAGRSLAACWRDEGNVVLAVSEPSMLRPDVAQVQLSTHSRFERSDGRVRSHYAHYLITVRKEGGAWRVVERRTLGIT